MLTLLREFAVESGRRKATESSSASLGEASTQISLRRGSSVINDDRVRPEASLEQQADSFRGTVYAAVDKIARRIAQLNLNLFTVEIDESKEVIDERRTIFHPFINLWSSANGHKPHEEYSAWDLKYVISASLDTTGESWCLIERDSLGRPVRVTPLPSYRMTIVINKDTGGIAGYLYVPKGTAIEAGGIFFPKMSWKELQENPTVPFMWYTRYPSPKGIEDPRGWSPIKAAAYAYDINLYEQIYKRNFLKNGAQLGGILQSETALSKQQIEEYLEQFQNRHAGFEKAGLPMVLPKMLTWTTTEPTPRDLQWAEAVNLTQSQILQIYGISDAKLGRADIGNRNTADAMDVTFNREVIQSRCDHLTASLNVDFLPVYPKQTDKLYFTTRFDDPVPADSEAQMKRERQDIELNVVTRNEIRKSRKIALYGKYGDQVYMPLTHIPVDPNESTLEISQDDADKFGFISAEDKAKLDAENAAKEGKEVESGSGKKDGSTDPDEDDNKEKGKGKGRGMVFTIGRDENGQISTITAR